MPSIITNAVQNAQKYMTINGGLAALRRNTSSACLGVDLYNVNCICDLLCLVIITADDCERAVN